MTPTPVCLDQSNWGHIAATGADRVRFLNGMVTGNIAALEVGGWLRTLMLTHKARVISILEVHVFAEYLLISCSPDLTSKTLAALDRHIVMDDVELEERSMAMHSVWNDAADVWTAAPVLAEPDGPVSSAEDIECLRIIAGMPRYGVDVTEDNFPFESELIRLIDYEKGCFSGQEPVSRVHHRGGGGSKRLLGLRADDNLPLQSGSVLSTAEKPKCGVVRSAVASSQLGSIALAEVHKSVWESGSKVNVDTHRTATVMSLPFERMES